MKVHTFSFFLFLAVAVVFSTATTSQATPYNTKQSPVKISKQEQVVKADASKSKTSTGKQAKSALRGNKKQTAKVAKKTKTAKKAEVQESDDIDVAALNSKAVPRPYPIDLSLDPTMSDLQRHYREWHGTRYRPGGASRAGVDCSGFTSLTVKELYGLQIPRSAREQAQQGETISRDALQPGDLVFFKRKNGNHVGIYLENGKFMHASTKKGVVISSMHTAYWDSKYWKAIRL